MRAAQGGRRRRPSWPASAPPTAATVRRWCRFLALWPRGSGRRPGSEIDAADRLAAFRADNEHYRGPSFPTISAAGAHGAIVHYRVSPAIEPAARGRHALPGRFGRAVPRRHHRRDPDGRRSATPTAEMRERFTLVLKGHIALATARFPRGTTGSQLDGLARAPLWRAGLDYDHGTGHGVGSYLGVHEGPQRISKLPSRVALQPGMIDLQRARLLQAGRLRHPHREPGRGGRAPRRRPAAEQELLGFETLTLAPIDRRLIDRSLLDGGGGRLARRLSCAGSRRAGAAGRRPDPDVAERRDAAVVTCGSGGRSGSVPSR